MYTVERLSVRHRANTKRHTTIQFDSHSQSRVTVNLTHACVLDCGRKLYTHRRERPQTAFEPRTFLL